MPLIAHRNLPGEHEEDASKCWCDPVVLEISGDDPRSVETIAAEILAELKAGEA